MKLERSSMLTEIGPTKATADFRSSLEPSTMSLQPDMNSPKKYLASKMLSQKKKELSSKTGKTPYGHLCQQR